MSDTFKCYCASTGQTIELDGDQTRQMLAAEKYQDVLQVISRVTSANIHEIMVPSCYTEDAKDQQDKADTMKQAQIVVYKLLDQGNHARHPPKEKELNYKDVFNMFPFAKDQPLWVIEVLKDTFNLRAPFDTISFFNTGGEFAYNELKELKDLGKQPSHAEKVNGLEIQDLHIQKMKEEDVKTLKGSTFTTINVFGTDADQQHDLDESMTIEKFKSFVLTLTDSKPFNLQFMMANNETLGDLKRKTEEWAKKYMEAKSDTIEVTERVQDGKYTLHYIGQDGKPAKYENCKRKTKIIEFKKYLGEPEQNKADPTKFKVYKLTFLDGTDVQTCLKKNKYNEPTTKVLFFNSENFPREEVTFGELGINRYSQIKVEIVDSKEQDPMAPDDLIIEHEKYIQFQDDEIESGKYKLSKFETQSTVQELIEKLKLKLKSDPIDRKFLVILDENNLEITDTSTKVTEILTTTKTLKVDYKGHFVLEFITLDDKLEPQFAYKFVPQAALQGQKIKLLANEKKMKEKGLDKLIELSDVAWGDLLQDDELKNDLKKHLKFLHNGNPVNDMAPRDLIPSYPNNVLCVLGIIRVILDRFQADHEHYVNTLEDNWISKEFMQTIYDQQLYDMKPLDEQGNTIQPSESVNNLLKNKPKKQFTKVEITKIQEEQNFTELMIGEIGELLEADDVKELDNWHAEKKQLSENCAGAGKESAIDIYQRLVKLHTSQALYPTLGKRFASGQYKEAQNYLKLLMVNVRNFGHVFKYTVHHKPVYRGVDPNSLLKLVDYKLGSIGQWPTFISCTKDQKLANQQSKNQQYYISDGIRKDNYQGKIVVFKIYLNDQNETATSIDLSQNNKTKFTFFPQEEEVLLLPMFTFQVTDVYESRKKETVTGKDKDGNKKDFNAKIVEITLAELPYSNLLNLKFIHESTLIWYTQGENTEAQDFGEKEAIKKIAYENCQNREQLFEAFEQSNRVTLIVSDTDGFDMVNHLLAKGINFNKTICNIIVKGKDKEFFKNPPQGLVRILEEGEDLAIVAIEMLAQAQAGVSKEGLLQKYKEDMEVKNKGKGKELAPKMQEKIEINQ